MQILLINKEALRILIQERERAKAQQGGGDSLSASFDEKQNVVTPSNRRKRRSSRRLSFGIQEVGFSDESDSDDDHRMDSSREWLNTSTVKRIGVKLFSVQRLTGVKYVCLSWTLW